MLKTVLILILSASVLMAENPSYYLFQHEVDYKRTTKDHIIGSTIISAEYIVLPVMMKNVWWKDGFELVNPFTVGKEDCEPFHVDESWHAAMTYFMQDAHYSILRRYFGIKSPIPSMSMTLFSWTLIEAVDAMAVGDQWTFSWNDEVGNIGGILNWYIHYKYPDFKFYIRAGVRDWGRFDDYVSNYHTFITDHETYTKKYAFDKYSMSKVEYIYKFYEELYSGIAVSKDRRLGDVYGYTIGWDSISYINKRHDGWWNYFTNAFTSSFSLSLSLTIWNREELFTLF